MAAVLRKDLKAARKSRLSRLLQEESPKIPPNMGPPGPWRRILDGSSGAGLKLLSGHWAHDRLPDEYSMSYCGGCS